MSPSAENTSPHPLLAEGVALHQGGRLDEAAKVYLQILSDLPQDFDATHLLGIVELQRGQFDSAQRLIQAALAANPCNAAAMGNLGTSYMRAGQSGAALNWFEAALELEPHSFTALINVGTALHNLGRHREAVPILRKAYAANANSYAACNLLAACLIKCDEPREAAVIFEAATRCDPGCAEGWSNLSVALNAIGQPEEAMQYATKALSLDPQSSVALGSLAAAQYEQGSTADAIDNYRKAIAIPGHSSQILLEFASALLACGLNEEAIIQLRRAIVLDSGNLKARWAMAIAHLKPIYADQSEMKASRESFSDALRGIVEWYRTAHGVSEPFNAVGVSQPFFLAYQELNNRELLSSYGALCTAWMSTLPDDAARTERRSALYTGLPGKSRKIRLGIVTAHIHEHSVWNAITKGWVDNLNAKNLDLYLFKLHPSCDLETARAKQSIAHFEERPTNLPSWVNAIQESNLDWIIYPEIGMHPLTLQLASLRLAPVQAVSWGHPETTGLSTLDFYISADAMEPPNAESNYTEKLLRLPNLGVYVEPLTAAPSNPGLRSLNLPRNEPLLLCAGAPFKYSPLYDDIWVQIARQLRKSFIKRSGGGRLIFFRSRSEAMDRILERRLRAAFDQSDVDFDSHVSIIPTLDRSRFFGLMRESALILDTPGFSGFNTTLQGIQCGLPTLAYEGEFMRGRLASALMQRLGLPELVVKTKEDFIHKAIELTANSSLRGRIRNKIDERRSLLFHDLDPIRALEQHVSDTVMSARA